MIGKNSLQKKVESSDFSTFSAMKLYYFDNEKEKVMLIRDLTYITAITYLCVCVCPIHLAEHPHC